MKKVSLLVIAMAVAFGSFAQLSVGIHGTANMASANAKWLGDLDFKKTMRAMPGAGIDVQYSLGKNFALRTGANYVQNGVTLTTTVVETSTIHIKVQNNLHYVQLPLSLLYTVPVMRTQFFAGGGGYISYGISGKTKARLTYENPDGHEVIIEEVDAFKKEEDGGSALKRTDYGVAALAGIRRANGLFVQAGYQLSLANIDGSEEKGTYKNRGLQLTIGFFFK